MFKRLHVIIALALALGSPALAQNTNSSAPQTRSRRTTANTSTRTTTTQTTNTRSTATPARSADREEGQTQAEQQRPEAAAQPRTRNKSAASRSSNGAGEAATAKDPSARGVLAAFESLLDGIRHADVNAVTSAYWNSPQLILFNNNGTVTRGWQQLHENRANSYPNMKDVKLDVRDLRVQMLGRDGALVTCLWTQSQVYKGTPETASGRMTIIFRRIGNGWKAIHLHTSPDAPEPSRLPASEQTTSPAQRPGSNP